MQSIPIGAMAHKCPLVYKLQERKVSAWLFLHHDIVILMIWAIPIMKTK